MTFTAPSLTTDKKVILAWWECGGHAPVSSPPNGYIKIGCGRDRFMGPPDKEFFVRLAPRSTPNGYAIKSIGSPAEGSHSICIGYSYIRAALNEFLVDHPVFAVLCRPEEAGAMFVRGIALAKSKSGVASDQEWIIPPPALCKSVMTGCEDLDYGSNHKLYYLCYS